MMITVTAIIFQFHLFVYSFKWQWTTENINKRFNQCYECITSKNIFRVQGRCLSERRLAVAPLCSSWNFIFSWWFVRRLFWETGVLHHADHHAELLSHTPHPWGLDGQLRCLRVTCHPGPGITPMHVRPLGGLTANRQSPSRHVFYGDILASP